MLIDFKNFLGSIHHSEPLLLCIFFKAQPSGESHPVPQSENDIVFEDYLLVDIKLTFGDVIKKPEKLKLDWNFVAVSITEPNRSGNEIKDFLSDMRKQLKSGLKLLATFGRDGFFISPSKIE